MTYGVGFVFHGERSRLYGLCTFEKPATSVVSFSTVRYAHRPVVMMWSVLSGLALPNQSSSKIGESVQSLAYMSASSV